MPKINGVKDGKGGTIYLEEKVLRSARLEIGSEMIAIPGDLQITLKLLPKARE